MPWPTWRHEILLALAVVSYCTRACTKEFGQIKGGCLMVPVISANALLVWLVWGFFMAIGWALGTWVVARLLGMVWRERP